MKNISEKVPEGFNLSKYDACKQWGKKEWYLALKIRREIMVRKIFQPNEDALSQAKMLLDNPLIQYK